MEVVLVLVLQKIKTDTEIPWDAHNLHWKGTAGEATLPCDERLALQYYYARSNGYQRIRSPTMLGRIFQKSAKTVSRELKRGMITHERSDIPFVRTEYNADHAQFDAETKMQAKGPPLKSGKHYALVNRIATLILDGHHRPYAVLNRRPWTA